MAGVRASVQGRHLRDEQQTVHRGHRDHREAGRGARRQVRRGSVHPGEIHGRVAARSQARELADVAHHDGHHWELAQLGWDCQVRISNQILEYKLLNYSVVGKYK